MPAQVAGDGQHTTRDAHQGVPGSFVSAGMGGRSSGEHRLPGPNQQVTADLRGKRVLLILKPDKLGFQIAHALLEAAHLGDHAEIGPADVAE
jgi:hypothetical protein